MYEVFIKFGDFGVYPLDKTIGYYDIDPTLKEIAEHAVVFINFRYCVNFPRAKELLGVTFIFDTKEQATLFKLKANLTA